MQELSAFGVRRADLRGESAYLDYVPRDDDDGLRNALREAIASARMLLVVGASAAGKSRSAAQVTYELLPQHRFVLPRAEMLADVVDLPLARLVPAVVWLDNAEDYTRPALGDTLERLLDAGMVAIGTIRLGALEGLTPAGDLRNPAGEALTDPKFVIRMNWRLGWSEKERARLSDYVNDQALLHAVEQGISLGAYCVAGSQLLQRLANAQADEERPGRYALVRTVLDWARTSIGQPIPINEAAKLMPVAQRRCVGDTLG